MVNLTRACIRAPVEGEPEMASPSLPPFLLTVLVRAPPAHHTSRSLVDLHVQGGKVSSSVRAALPDGDRDVGTKVHPMAFRTALPIGAFACLATITRKRN